MEGRAGWVQQQLCAIGFDELTSMVSELMALHEHSEIECDHNWVSPSTHTRVIRHGSSASLFSVLNQVPDAVAAEYEVIHCGIKVFSWCEYRWPHLQSSDALQYPSGDVSIPEACLLELMQFHILHATAWLRRYRAFMLESSVGDIHAGNASVGRVTAIKIDKVGIVAEPDRIHFQ
jgi:hypothetical protein